MFYTLLLLSCVIFGSCASRASVRDNRLHAYLTEKSKYILLPPSGIEKALDMAQYVSASYGGRDYFLNAWVKADETGIEMVLFNELGANMGNLSYRDGAVDFSSPVFPESLKPEYIVADFQLCFYNPQLLRRALEACGLIFETQGSTRLIRNGKDLIIKIEKTHNEVRLVNYVRGYSYTLEGDFE